MSFAGRPIRGVIFDLDGTLVDSGLDFEAMRREMELPNGTSILEAIDALPIERAAACRSILARHEWEGARRAQLTPGVASFLVMLTERRIRTAVLTRNGREIALFTLTRLKLAFERLVAREDAPAKPDPSGVERIREGWGFDRSEVAILGDYRHDLEAGRRAGVRTILFTAGRDPARLPYAHLADRVLPSFEQADDLLAWLASPESPES